MARPPPVEARGGLRVLLLMASQPDKSWGLPPWGSLEGPASWEQTGLLGPCWWPGRKDGSAAFKAEGGSGRVVSTCPPNPAPKGKALTWGGIPPPRSPQPPLTPLQPREHHPISQMRTWRPETELGADPQEGRQAVPASGQRPLHAPRHHPRLAELMEQHQEELATIEALDAGAVYTLALKTHVGMSIQTFRYFAGWCDKIQVGL